MGWGSAEQTVRRVPDAVQVGSDQALPALARRERVAQYLHATGWRVNRSPRALVTLRTVAQVGLPSAERAL